MYLVRCKCCNTELMSSSKPQCCGCPNQTVLVGEKITAVDLTQVVLINSGEILKKGSVFSKQDLEYQEARRKRRVRKLDFEER
jgi:hypothetical protein